MGGKKYKLLTFMGEELERELIVMGNQMLSGKQLHGDTATSPTS